MRRALVVQDIRTKLDDLGRQNGEYMTVGELDELRSWVANYVAAAVGLSIEGSRYEAARAAFARAQGTR